MGRRVARVTRLRVDRLDVEESVTGNRYPVSSLPPSLGTGNWLLATGHWLLADVASTQYPVPGIRFIISAGHWQLATGWVIGTGHWLTSQVPSIRYPVHYLGWPLATGYWLLATGHCLLGGRVEPVHNTRRHHPRLTPKAKVSARRGSPSAVRLSARRNSPEITANLLSW